MWRYDLQEQYESMNVMINKYTTN